jgi:hypothetical protein
VGVGAACLMKGIEQESAAANKTKINNPGRRGNGLRITGSMLKERQKNIALANLPGAGWQIAEKIIGV